jgi:hypothetical protein
MASTERASIAASGADLVSFTAAFRRGDGKVLTLVKSEACHLNANGRLFAGRLWNNYRAERIRPQP